MILHELKSLFKNRFLMVILIAIITIPALYTTIFLGSMWDPYGNVENLPVAIVNEDEVVTYNGTKMNVGEELIDNLKENYFMDFNFVDEETANAGLENGTYYMVVTIPKNFSSNATTIMEDEPSKMELDFETNPGTNYIASKMSETALTKIRESVSEKITEVYTKTVYEKIDEIGSGMGKAADGAEKIKNGITKLSDGNEEITKNLNKLTSGTLTFDDGAEKLETGLKEYTEGVSQVNTGTKAVSQGLSSLSNGASTFSTGIEKLATGSGSLVTGTKNYTKGVDSAYVGTTELIKNNDTLNAGVDSLSTGVTQLKSGSSTILGGLQTMSDTIGGVMTEEQQNKISQVEQGLLSLNQSIQALNTTMQNADLSKPEVAGALKDNMNQIATNSDVLLTGASTSVDQLSSGLLNVKTVLDQTGTTAADMGLIQGMETLDSGIASVETGVNGTEESDTDGLVGGIHAYTQGVDKLNTGLGTLSKNSETLNSGAASLNSGISTLKENVPSLTQGISKLNSGAASLYKGTSELVSNNESLLSGTNQLATGSENISAGASALAAGSEGLGEGIGKLSSGTDTLESSLIDGADEIDKVNTSDDAVKMFAAPVDTEKVEVSKVDNNGTAMAAYMMTVALWIACLALCMFYPITKHHGILKSGFSWWFSKSTILGIVAVVQAVVMVLVIRVIHGFDPLELGKTIVVACFASLTFMSIVLFFDVAFGKVGSYILFVMMLLQLSACAGTYPIELSSDFYNVIHKFMPFTYAVDAFRKTIATGGSIRPQILVMSVIILAFSIFTILVYQIKLKKENGKLRVLTA